MTQDEPARLVLPRRGRLVVVAGLSLLALPVVFSFFFFGMVAAAGCVVDCTRPAPQPLAAGGLALGAAVMGGGWAGLVPWSLGRPDLIARTFVAGALLLLALFGVLVVLG